MNSQQKEVLRKIIYALETGGQIYGNCAYEDFTEAYTNSNLETAITIGAGAWFATEALSLLKRIYEKDKTLFSQSLINDMNNKNWSYYAISRNSENAKTIIRIISSNIGKKCQDELLDEQMEKYCNYARDLGVTTADGQAMVANWIHQGSTGAAKRIISKTAKPYTLDNLYAACCTDTEPNQVGSYRTRQKKAYEWLKQYMPKDNTVNSSTLQKGSDVMSTDIETTNNVVEKAISFMEKVANDDSHGYDQIYRWNERGDYDCSSLVITAWENAGVPVKRKGATYTGNMYNVFISCGFKNVTNTINLSTGNGLVRGDVLLNHVHHVAMYCGNGKEVEASINEHGGATGGQPGDQTSREILIRTYRNYPWNVVLRYQDSSDGTLRYGSTGEEVKLMQKMLIACGFSCGSYGADGDWGNATSQAVSAFRKANGLSSELVYDDKMRTALQKAYQNIQEPTFEGVGKPEVEDVITTDVFPKTMYVIKGPAKLRKAARKTGELVANIKAKEAVTVTKEKTNSAGNVWCKCKYGVNVGWIVKSNLTDKKP